jgi:uncharacterized RDD family membrane protein YckC
VTAVASAPARNRPLGSDRRRLAEILPPEGVPLHFEIAGLGARLAAQLIDIVITLGVAGAIILLVFLVQLGASSSLVVIAALLFFFVRVPYYVATELLWNGQTIGKRICALRVISGSGRSLSAHQVVARNLMKEMEVFLPGMYLFVAANLGIIESVLVCAWVAALIAVPVFNKRRQRVGDIVAETIVIHQPPSMLEPDLAAATPATFGHRFVFLPHQLEHYGAFELQVLEKLLHGGERARNAAEHARNQANLAIVTDRIRGKIGYSERIDPVEREAFLHAFYVAQRAHLEQRRLFGDARADKFHRQSDRTERGPE